MSEKVRKRNRKNLSNLPEIKYGTPENVVLTGVKMDSDLKNPQTHIFLTFTQYDGETPIRKSTYHWFVLNLSKMRDKQGVTEYVMTSVRDVAFQLHNLLSCYMTEDEAFAALEDDFKPFEYETPNDLINGKWTKSIGDEALKNIKGLFETAITPFIGQTDTKLRLKVIPNKKGTFNALPRFGAICEPMDAEESVLSFSAYELNLMGNLATTDEEKNVIKKSNNEQTM